MTKINTLLGMDLFREYFLDSLIFHIPHSSTAIPTEAIKTYVSEEVLVKEMGLLTDFSTDEIFNFDFGKSIVFPYSRIFCDVERLKDEDEPMYQKGRGFYYTKTDSGKTLRKENKKEKAYLKKHLYNAHHNYLEKIVGDKLNTNGFATIIDCHSFSDTPFKSDIEQGNDRPDFCLGTDDAHTPNWLLSIVHTFLIQKGFTVAINYPYSGTIVPKKYHQKNCNVNSLMIEVNRKLYIEKGKVNIRVVNSLNDMFTEMFNNI